MSLVAPYKNRKGEIIEIDLIEVSPGTFVLETEDGRRRAFDVTLSDDPTQGVLTFTGDFVEKKAPLPVPNSPERTEALTELQRMMDRFPVAEFEIFVAQPSQLELKKAILARNNFATATHPQILRWSTLLTEGLERRAAEAKANEPPLVFSRYDLTRDFWHSRADYGDLKIDGPEPKQRGTAAQAFEDTEWWVYCGACEKSGQHTRYATARVLLEIEAGPDRRPKFICQRPCKH